MPQADYKPFSDSPAILELFARIGEIEANGGLGTPDNWLATAEEIRDLASHSDGDIIGLLPATLYAYSSTETSADDGDNYIKPNNTTDGRWVKKITFSVAGHGHTEKIDRPTGNMLKPGEFYTVNSAGDIVPLGVSAASFVAAVTGYGLSKNSFEDEHLATLENLPQDIDVSGKIAKIAATQSNEGNLIALGASTDSGREVADLGIKLYDLLHIVSPSVSTAIQGETITLTLRNSTEFTLAKIEILFSTAGYHVRSTIEIDNTGELIQDIQNQYVDGFEYAISTTVTNNIPVTTITFTTTPAEVTITPAKILYL